MLKKFVVAVGCAIFATAALADASGVWADGHVTYQHPNGRLISRDCSMFVPARGAGEVTLKCGDFATSSSEFATERRSGQIIFSVLFREIAGAPEGTVAKYRGSYLRGTNKAVFYGDVFASSDTAATLGSDAEWRYVGGFMFAKSIGSAPSERTSATEVHPLQIAADKDRNP